MSACPHSILTTQSRRTGIFDDIDVARGTPKAGALAPAPSSPVVDEAAEVMSRGTVAEDEMSMPISAAARADSEMAERAEEERGDTLLSPGGIRRKRSKAKVPEAGGDGGEGEGGDQQDELSPVEPAAAEDDGTPRSLSDQELRILELEALNKDLEVQLEKSSMENDRLKSRLKTILWE